LLFPLRPSWFAYSEAFLKAGDNNVDAAEIEKLIAARNVARHSKNWAEADRIRKQLTHMGITLENSVNGTHWRRA